MLINAIRAAGHEAVAHDTVFPPTAEDEEWIAYAGRHQLIVITKDKMIRKRPNELAALRAASLQAIVLTSGDTRMAEYATQLVLVLPEIEALLRANDPPTIIRVASSGAVSIVPPAPLNLRQRKP